ncbi:MAG: phosphatase PAP2 family protein [Armatimonadia bacterium]
MAESLSSPVASMASPFRSPRRYLLPAIVLISWLALVTVVLVADQPVERYWDRLTENVAVADGVAVFLTLLVSYHSIGLGLLLLCLLDRRLRWQFMRHAAVLMLGQAVLCGLIKQLFGRLRPNVAAEATIFYGPSTSFMSFSFPSGHATAAWTLAGIMSTYYPRWKWLFMILATAVCLSRVQLDRHFPSDILAGGLLGWYLAVWTLKWLRRPARPEKAPEPAAA